MTSLYVEPVNECLQWLFIAYLFYRMARNDRRAVIAADALLAALQDKESEK